MRLELRSGFLFFLALLAQLDSFGVFWPYLAAAAGHEAAHAAAVYLCGGRITRLRLGFGDLQMAATPLGDRALCFCAAAGPAANLLCALTLGRRAPVFAAVSLLLGLYNLLPLAQLDGGTLLRLLLCRFFPIHGAQAAQWVSTGCLALLLVLAAQVSLARGGGPFPLLAAALVASRALCSGGAGLLFRRIAVKIKPNPQQRTNCHD